MPRRVRLPHHRPSRPPEARARDGTATRAVLRTGWASPAPPRRSRRRWPAPPSAPQTAVRARSRSTRTGSSRSAHPGATATAADPLQEALDQRATTRAAASVAPVPRHRTPPGAPGPGPALWLGAAHRPLTAEVLAREIPKETSPKPTRARPATAHPPQHQPTDRRGPEGRLRPLDEVAHHSAPGRRLAGSRLAGSRLAGRAGGTGRRGWASRARSAVRFGADARSARTYRSSTCPAPPLAVGARGTRRASTERRRSSRPDRPPTSTGRTGPSTASPAACAPASRSGSTPYLSQKGRTRWPSWKAPPRDVRKTVATEASRMFASSAEKRSRAPASPMGSREIRVSERADGKAAARERTSPPAQGARASVTSEAGEPESTARSSARQRVQRGANASAGTLMLCRPGSPASTRHSARPRRCCSSPSAPGPPDCSAIGRAQRPIP
eukprot:scaffold20587_cov110-Isochrysis_galbana.AAC.9